jgi:hypothetical protein
MSTPSTPGPGGFGSAPAFGHARAGITLEPAQTRPRIGVYSGPAAVTGNHLWWWVALVIAIAVVATVTVTVRRRRRRHAQSSMAR